MTWIADYCKGLVEYDDEKFSQYKYITHEIVLVDNVTCYCSLLLYALKHRNRDAVKHLWLNGDSIYIFGYRYQEMFTPDYVTSKDWEIMRRYIQFYLHEYTLLHVDICGIIESYANLINQINFKFY